MGASKVGRENVASSGRSSEAAFASLILSLSLEVWLAWELFVERAMEGICVLTQLLGLKSSLLCVRSPRLVRCLLASAVPSRGRGSQIPVGILPQWPLYLDRLRSSAPVPDAEVEVVLFSIMEFKSTSQIVKNFDFLFAFGGAFSLGCKRRTAKALSVLDASWLYGGELRTSFVLCKGWREEGATFLNASCISEASTSDQVHTL